MWALSYPHARSHTHTWLTPAGTAKLLNLSAGRLWSPGQVTANSVAETTQSYHLTVSLDLRGRLRGRDQVACSLAQRPKLVPARLALTRRWEGWSGICCKRLRVRGRIQVLVVGGLRACFLQLLAGPPLAPRGPARGPSHLQTNTHLLVPGVPGSSLMSPSCQISLPPANRSLLLRAHVIALDLPRQSRIISHLWV